MSRPARIPLDEALAQLPGWVGASDPEAVCKTFRFKDFSAAFGFITRAAMKAEQRDHHPEWSNIYNRVEVRLTTHDAGGVTALDVEFARFFDSIAG